MFFEYTMNKAFERHDPPGAPIALVLDSPHSGEWYPDDFDHAPPRDVVRQAEDTHVARLWNSAPAHGATLIEARFPRAYIDANRSLADIDADLLADAWPEPIAPSRKTQQGIGLVWRLARGGTPMCARRLACAEVRARIDRFWRPYHAELDLFDQRSPRKWRRGSIAIRCRPQATAAAPPKNVARFRSRFEARSMDERTTRQWNEGYARLQNDLARPPRFLRPRERTDSRRCGVNFPIPDPLMSDHLTTPRRAATVPQRRRTPANGGRKNRTRRAAQHRIQGGFHEIDPTRVRRALCARVQVGARRLPRAPDSVDSRGRRRRTDATARIIGIAAREGARPAGQRRQSDGRQRRGRPQRHRAGGARRLVPSASSQLRIGMMHWQGLI
jgi:hypothetical protein